MSVAAPKSDHRTSPQHQFSKNGWSQYSDSALKVRDIIFDVVLNFLNKPLFEGWPTDYERASFKGSTINHLDVLYLFNSLCSVFFFLCASDSFLRFQTWVTHHLGHVTLGPEPLVWSNLDPNQRLYSLSSLIL